jgi:cation:H+ antiporter
LSTNVAITLFCVSLVVTLAASVLLAATIDRVGQRFGLTEATVGILTALAADGPEISSAIAALVHHQHEVSLGVILGSNTFNVAALLALPAVLSGAIRMGRHGLLLAGGVSLLTTAAGIALVVGALPPAAASAVVLVVLAGYVGVTAMRPATIARRSPGRVASWLALAVREEDEDSLLPGRPRRAGAGAWVVLPVTVAVVIAGSTEMVDTATRLGGRWGISPVVVGALVLGAVTGLPNVVAAVRLARLRRGAAVVSEGLNSNTLNLAAGLCLPALVVGVSPVTAGTAVTVVALGVITALAVGLAIGGGGLSRSGGALVVAVYCGYVAVLAGSN